MLDNYFMQIIIKKSNDNNAYFKDLFLYEHYCYIAKMSNH